MLQVPRVDYAIINGSGTWAGRFPEDAADTDVSVLEENLVFDTPFGPTVPLKLIRIGTGGNGVPPKEVLVVPMHGWRYGQEAEFTRIQCCDQIFWVLQQAGVKKIIGEASCGSINPLLEPLDIVVPHDFIEGRITRGTSFTGDVRVIDALCPGMRQTLIEAADPIFRRVMRRGIYICSEGPRFETPAEIQMMRGWGADIIAQSLTPEVYYARYIGACYATVNVVVNYAEGVNDEWEIDDLVDIYQGLAPRMSRLLLNAMKRASHASCNCAQYQTVPRLAKKVLSR